MNPLLWAFLATYLGVLSFLALLLVRNQRVFDYKMRLIEQVHVAAKSDIDAGSEWEWRYEAIEAVPYEEMLWHFWRPLDSFYGDRSFLSPEGGPALNP